MGYNKRKEKRKKKKNLQLILIAIIFVYLIFRSVPSLLANSAKVILPERDILINKELVESVIIKKEDVFKASESGMLELFGIEGERVSSGSKVASISKSEDSSDLQDKLKEIDKNIMEIEDSQREKTDNIEKEKKLEDLKLSKEKITNEINSNFINYYTNIGGIISYKIDGYEEEYIPRDFESYTYDKVDPKKIKINDIKLKSKIIVDEPVYKIIDNFEWYMAINIENLEENNSYENGDIIRIEVKEDGKEIAGKLVTINNSENNLTLIVKFNTMLHSYYDERFPEVYLIKEKIEGYKIPKKAIIEKDSIEGVYIKDTSGIVKFRPVKILEEKDKNVYIDMGDRNSNIESLEGKELVKTVSIHDEIFINTINIKEGQIID